MLRYAACELSIIGEKRSRELSRAVKAGIAENHRRLKARQPNLVTRRLSAAVMRRSIHWRYVVGGY
jgi:hypothetical protein